MVFRKKKKEQKPEFEDAEADNIEISENGTKEEKAQVSIEQTFSAYQLETLNLLAAIYKKNEEAVDLLKKLNEE